MQDSIQTLKVTNINFSKSQNYELSLNSKIIDGVKYYDHYFGSRYKGIWFALLRIAECSNEGTRIKCIILILLYKKSCKDKKLFPKKGLTLKVINHLVTQIYKFYV